MSCPLKCLSWSWKKTVIRPKKWPQMTSLTSEYQAGVCISFENHFCPPIFQFVFSKVTACRARHMPKAEKIWSFRGVPRNSFPLGKKYDIEFCLFSVWAKNHLFPSLFLFPSFAFSFFSFFSFLSTQKLISPQGGGSRQKNKHPCIP